MLPILCFMEFGKLRNHKKGFQTNFLKTLCDWLTITQTLNDWLRVQFSQPHFENSPEFILTIYQGA